MREALLVVLLVLAAPLSISAFIELEQGFSLAKEASGEVLCAAGEDDLPQDFLDFKANPAYAAVRFDKDASVCGFESSISPEQTREAIREELEGNDWVCLPSDETSLCFTREQGAYCWAYVSCGQVEGKTVVVCHLA